MHCRDMNVSAYELLTMYLAIYEVLDSESSPISLVASSTLSALSAKIAIEYHERTNVKIGVALGWA
jgi:hypothetical protein